MADYVTGTGFRITPVVGLLPPGLALRPAPHEVESVFELPLDVLLDPDAPQRQRHDVRGIWREYWVWPHPDHYIWGATAAILVHLAQKLRADGAACCGWLKLALFLAPFAVFVDLALAVGQRSAARRTSVARRRAALWSLLHAGDAVWLCQRSALPRRRRLRPGAHCENGRIVPGHAAPR